MLDSERDALYGRSPLDRLIQLQADLEQEVADLRSGPVIPEHWKAAKRLEEILKRSKGEAG
jgi:hypothetical protein